MDKTTDVVYESSDEESLEESVPCETSTPNQVPRQPKKKLGVLYARYKAERRLHLLEEKRKNLEEKRKKERQRRLREIGIQTNFEDEPSNSITEMFLETMLVMDRRTQELTQDLHDVQKFLQKRTPKQVLGKWKHILKSIEKY